MSRERILGLAEVILVLALAASAVLQVHAAPAGELQGGPAVHDVLVLGITLPLLLRRRYAVAVFCSVAAAAWLQFELGAGLGQPFLAILVALYSVGAYAAIPAALVGPFAVLALVVVDVPRLLDGAPWDEVVPAWFVLGGAWALGRWVRHRRTEARALSARAESAERDAEAQARAAVTEERARIARELHDLVAHSMGVIVIQSQGAQRALDDPERARSALEAIEAAGRDGLSELRRLLELLTDPGTPPEVAPQPSLEGVTELVDRVGRAGVDIAVEVEGRPHDLPAGVELAAYRVVQEGLTNVLKHARGAAVEVRLVYGRDSVEVSVVNQPGPAPHQVEHDDHAGRGLVGMRERVALYGGRLEAGPRPGGGYAVSALIPTGATS